MEDPELKVDIYSGIGPSIFTGDISYSCCFHISYFVLHCRLYCLLTLNYTGGVLVLSFLLANGTINCPVFMSIHRIGLNGADILLFVRWSDVTCCDI